MVTRGILRHGAWTRTRPKRAQNPHLKDKGEGKGAKVAFAHPFMPCRHALLLNHLVAVLHLGVEVIGEVSHGLVKFFARSHRVRQVLLKRDLWTQRQRHTTI